MSPPLTIQRSNKRTWKNASISYLIKIILVLSLLECPHDITIMLLKIFESKLLWISGHLKWLLCDSNPQSLSSYMYTQPLCCISLFYFCHLKLHISHLLCSRNRFIVCDLTKTYYQKIYLTQILRNFVSWLWQDSSIKSVQKKIWHTKIY